MPLQAFGAPLKSAVFHSPSSKHLLKQKHSFLKSYPIKEKKCVFWHTRFKCVRLPAYLMLGICTLYNNVHSAPMDAVELMWHRSLLLLMFWKSCVKIKVSSSGIVSSGHFLYVPRKFLNIVSQSFMKCLLLSVLRCLVDNITWHHVLIFIKHFRWKSLALSKD